MPLSLDVGLRKGKWMAREHGLPFIPVHHMEAHALMVRMMEKVGWTSRILFFLVGRFQNHSLVFTGDCRGKAHLIKSDAPRRRFLKNANFH